jgi:hypothetical protein
MPERQAQFAELELLLHSEGIVDDCSKRLVEELQDHFQDLAAEAFSNGQDIRQACATALREIGAPGDIAAVAVQYRDLLSVSRRYPLIAGLAASLVNAPALPVAYCTERRESIARWGASIGLAGVLTAGLLLTLQTMVGTVI